MKIFKNQRGDTIMEVMISVAILSLILGASFALANRNSQANRQAEERSEAYKGTESQMELLKSFLGASSTASLPAEGSKFCMKDDGSGTVSVTGLTEPVDPEQFQTKIESAPELSACKKGEFYYSYIQRGDTAGTDGLSKDTFRVHTRWYNASGTGIDESTMVHRIYPNLGSLDGGLLNLPTCSPHQFINALGQCENCPAGEANPSGNGTGCTEVPPEVEIVVQRLNDGPGRTTASCSSNDVTNVQNIPVNLSRASYSKTINTNTLSTAFFSSAENLQKNTTYSISPTLPLRHSLCPNPASSITTGGKGTEIAKGSKVTITLKYKRDYPAVTPLHRCYQFNTFTGDNRRFTNHIYVIGSDSSICISGTNGGQYEGVIGYVPTDWVTNSTPVYGGFNDNDFDTFITTSYYEYAQAYVYGWNTVGSQPYNRNGYLGFHFFVSGGGRNNATCSEPDTIPLYRWWSPGVGNHVYTTSLGENPNYYGVADGGGNFYEEGVAGCIFPS